VKSETEPKDQAQGQCVNTRAAEQKLKSAAIKEVKKPQPEPEAQPAVYCICRSSDEQNMIMCDYCEEWYHYKCINLTPVSILAPSELARRDGS
jgi:hypothetical protein